jgi:hypothetical protein
MTGVSLNATDFALSLRQPGVQRTRLISKGQVLMRVLEDGTDVSLMKHS